MIMGSNYHLPFEAGQQAESKSFIEGFRGAWFRSKIKKISYRGQQIGYHLKYFDYPGEKIEWIRPYQKPPHEESKLELMVRPPFPPLCCESQLSAFFPETDVIAVMDDTWKAGDLVDWWYENCYWSARIIGLVGKDKVEIQLPDPPIGEGNSYKASYKDLRPSLDWSPENGWTVPLSMESGSCRQCVRLIWLHNQDKESRDEHTQVESTTERNDTGFDMKSGNLENERSNSLSKVSDSHDEKAVSSVLDKRPSRKDRYSLDTTDGKRISDYKYRASIRCSETIESSILELEEIANKIRWLKGFLQVGFQWSNAMKPSWRFL